MACSLDQVHSMSVRWVSWSLRAKCFMKEYTPLSAAPLMAVEAMAPDR